MKASNARAATLNCLAGLVLGAFLLAPLVLSADGMPPGSGYENGTPGAGTRVKDIAEIEGVRSNQLVGYGLVMGLNGTGDNTNNSKFTSQSITSMLQQLGVQLPEGTRIRPKNTAAVMVSATLPPFVKQGQTIDVTVSSLGNAESLRGGTLLMTPLKGPDGQVYALAQGSLIVGGFGAQGADGSKITVNIPSAGRVPNGAIVERAVDSPFATSSEITLNLHRPDFTTAKRLADAINNRMGRGVATPMDGASVKVRAPQKAGSRVGFVSKIENITLEPGEAPARVIINARTGTVVIGERVIVRPAAVSHGNLVVSISEKPMVSQPAPISHGRTVVTPNSDIDISEQGRMFMMQPGTTLQEIVNAVNQVGAAPGDLVAILEALREAGALRAELVVI